MHWQAKFLKWSLISLKYWTMHYILAYQSITLDFCEKNQISFRRMITNLVSEDNVDLLGVCVNECRPEWGPETVKHQTMTHLLVLRNQVLKRGNFSLQDFSKKWNTNSQFYSIKKTIVILSPDNTFYNKITIFIAICYQLPWQHTTN